MSIHAYKEPVMNAINNNNLEALRNYVEIPGIIHLKDNSNIPLIFYVVRTPLETHIPILQIFLDAGLNPNITNQYNENLMYIYIENFVDINNSSGNSEAKSIVNSESFYTIIKFLFDKGFTINKSSIRRGKSAKEHIQSLAYQVKLNPQMYMQEAIDSIQRIYRLFTEQTQKPTFTNQNISSGHSGYVYPLPQNKAGLRHLPRNIRSYPDPRSFFNINTANRGFRGGKRTRRVRHKKSKTSKRRH